MNKTRRGRHHRGALEIAGEILYEATGGTTRQKTMIRVSLSFVQARHYLSLLISWGFLEYRPGDRTFSTTPKGTAYLDAYESGSTLVSMPR